jgi:beta-lactamase superfamily II metal-dependent hydrolase
MRLATLLFVVMFAIGIQFAAHADQVITRDSVTHFVNIRRMPTASSQAIGRLEPGQRLAYVESAPNWHKVRLSDGQEGFVFKANTLVVPDAINLSSAAMPFAVHFLDVGTGDSAIIDMGDREIVIDGGDSATVLAQYAEDTGIISGPIELVVVTHGDTDHWRGLNRLLGFDKKGSDTVPSVLEFWDAGYDRDCNPTGDPGRLGYQRFIGNMRSVVPASKFLRPLSDHHASAVVTDTLEPFELPSLPGVRFTVLHTDANPTQGDCSYKINNASIVLMIEIGGIKFLFTGDANGKERDEGSPGTPGHVEEKLLALEDRHPGTLRANVLKVPHHGSETASTQAFIDKVNPAFAVISASTKHHLPRDSVIERYENTDAILLRTDQHHENNTDHIVCLTSDGALDCNFVSVLNE